MQHVHCYACGSSQSSDYAHENGYHLVKCASCGLLYVNPRPAAEDVERAHQLGEHAGAARIKTTGFRDFSKVSSYERTLRDIFGNGAVLHAKKWLDIGCGYGEFLEALNRFSAGGVTAIGVEPNVKKTAAARKRGLDVRNLDLSAHQDRYHYISILNVYSHLIDPPEALAAWSRLLVPGGQIILETGDTANLTAAEHPRPLHLPDHLSFASEKIVRHVLDGAGFEILGVHKYPEVRETPSAILREAAKVLIPGKKSKIWHVIRRDSKSYDMYVHAGLKR